MSTSCVSSTVGIITGWVLIETNKDLIFQYLWLVGIASLVLSVSLSFALVAIGGEYVWTFYLSAIPTCISAGAGWYAAINKKNDRNLQYAVERFSQHLVRMEVAENRLATALETMRLSGTDIDQLDKEVNEEVRGIENNIKTISRINNENMESDKGHAHELAIVRVASRDRFFGEPQIKRIDELVTNMSWAHTPADLEAIQRLKTALLDKLDKKPLAEDGKTRERLTAGEVQAILQTHKVFDFILAPPDPGAAWIQSLHEQNLAAKRIQAGARGRASRRRVSVVLRRTVMVVAAVSSPRGDHVSHPDSTVSSLSVDQV